MASIGKELRDEAAAYADSFFAELFGPDAFEAYPHGRKDGHVENGQESVRDAFRAGEVQGDAAKAEIDNASAVRRLVA